MNPARHLRNDESPARKRQGRAWAALMLALTLAGCSRPEPQTSAAAQQPAAPPSAVTAPEAEAAAPGHGHAPGAATHEDAPAATHQDHDDRYGGDFFMALDQKHHLEGVLMEPGVFRVYLFDEYTKPLAREAVAKAAANVTWGRAENSPEIAMKPSADGLTLEAKAPGKLTFPTELTLRIRFPGAPANSRPELFTFPFRAFTQHGSAHQH